MTLARQRTGRLGEDHACAYLADRGMAILARNSRTRAGEIDAVGMDRGTLVFIEVKTMRTGARSGPERPVFAVGPRKQLRFAGSPAPGWPRTRPPATARSASTWSASPWTRPARPWQLSTSPTRSDGDDSSGLD